MPLRFNYNRFVRLSFDLYLAWAFRKHFARILLRREPSALAKTQPLILVANHTSWWDGFFLWQIQKSIRPKSAVYTVMLQKEFEQLPFFFRWLGVLTLTPKNFGSVRRIFQTLVTLGQSDPTCVIVFFPQGKIWPATRRPLRFESGIEFLRRQLPRAQFLPVGIHIEPLQHQKPTTFLSVGPVVKETECLEASVTKQLECIQNELNEFGESHQW